MSPRMKTSVYLNPKIVKEARDLGLHISMIANDCLEQAVKKMKVSNRLSSQMEAETRQGKGN